MKLLSKTKCLLLPIEVENEWPVEDKDTLKLGKVAFDFKNEEIDVKKGSEVYYQYGSKIKIEGTEYILVSQNDLLCQK